MNASSSAHPAWRAAFAIAMAVVATRGDGGARAMPRAMPVGTASVPRGSPEEAAVYRGYHLDLSALAGRPDALQLRRAAEHQVDLVEDTVLAPPTREFLRGLVIVVSAGPGEGGHYSGGRAVTINVDSPTDDRPILLHEFMHAYHLLRMPGGVRNPDILAFYHRAKADRLYPADAYVLKNPKEFFAMTTSLYLHGRLARPPFTRAELARRQPVYFRYLAGLFGPVRG